MLDKQDKEHSMRYQARLLGVSRSGAYYIPAINDESFLANEIFEIYSKSGCRYGYRKIHAELIERGFVINHKKVLRIMNELGFEGLYPKQKQAKYENKENKIYPYLLDNLELVRVNQVWATDITYIRLNDRFMYFIAIIDLYSRYIIYHGLNYNLEAEFYVDILSNALLTGTPEIFNTDQGVQFTSNEFTQLLLLHEVQISMDHKGRCFDNIYAERLWRSVKQEAVYYYRPETVGELEKVLNEYVVWYNYERVHQSLGYRRPAEVYKHRTRFL